MKNSLPVLLLFFIVQSFAQRNSNIDSVSKSTSVFTNLRYKCAPSIEKYYEPLYVVDGKIVSATEIRNIKPETIESITVLKDSAAINLCRRSNSGVILITTKKRFKREPKRNKEK